MDSINKNQPENNRANLASTDAIEQIKELAGKAKSCFFCTENATESHHGVRPMTIQRIDENGSMWFLSSKDSHKNLELENDPRVKLFFQGSPHSDFLYLEGHVRISSDKATIRELWEPIMKTWFTEGVDDPRISALQFIPEDGYYWDTKHGNVVAGIKMLIGAAVGKTLDDSVEGVLTMK